MMAFLVQSISIHGNWSSIFFHKMVNNNIVPGKVMRSQELQPTHSGLMLQFGPLVLVHLGKCLSQIIRVQRGLLIDGDQ